MDEPTIDTAFLVSVIVVNWNGRDIVRECLDSLLEQRDSEFTREIIVVDNGSTDDSLTMLSANYPSVRLLALPHNLGFAGGVNAGIEAARGSTIVLVNNDAVADPEFIHHIAGALKSNPEAAAVTGRILLSQSYSPVPAGTAEALVGIDGTCWIIDDRSGEQLVNSTGNEVTISGNGRDRDWLTPARIDNRPAGSVMGFSGGAVALRRKALTEVGRFDDRLFMYYEDSDLSWRFRRAGWDIRYEPTAVVYHQHAASSGTSSDFFLFHNERNRLLVALKNAPLAVIWRAFMRTGGSAVTALLRGRFGVAGRKLHSLGAAIHKAPQFLADRHRTERDARVPRAVVARHLVGE